MTLGSRVGGNDGKKDFRQQAKRKKAGASRAG